MRQGLNEYEWNHSSSSGSLQGSVKGGRGANKGEGSVKGGMHGPVRPTDVISIDAHDLRQIIDQSIQRPIHLSLQREIPAVLQQALPRVAFDAMQQSARQVQAVMERRFEAFDQRFDGFFDAVNRRLNALDYRFSAIEQRIHHGEQRTAALERSFLRLHDEVFENVYPLLESIAYTLHGASWKGKKGGQGFSEKGGALSKGSGSSSKSSKGAGGLLPNATPLTSEMISGGRGSSSSSKGSRRGIRSGMSSAEEQKEEQEDQAAHGYPSLKRDGQQPMTLGSQNHPFGCQPCSFYCFSNRGCKKGLSCEYCHMLHVAKSNRRSMRSAGNPTLAAQDDVEDYPGSPYASSSGSTHPYLPNL